MMTHIRPKVTDELVDEIRQTISNNPDWNRTVLSKELCKRWGWQSENGQINDISCRSMLRALDASGRINLPKPKWVPRVKGVKESVVHIEHDTANIEAPLSELVPLRIEVVTSKEGSKVFKSYIDQYHYLGYDRAISETMKYAVYARDGTPISNLMFGASAWACRPRDEFIGWDREQRQAGLRYTANNNRFLIYPWIRVRFLASHILSLICRRISCDWQARYGHGIYCLETFVERPRFRGISYQASNWVCVGQTTGRGRNSTTSRAVLPIKDIYVYPLAKEFRKLLCSSASLLK